MSELVEVRQIPYKCDKCDHAGSVEAIIKRKPQKVIMEDGDDLSSIKKDLAELKAANAKPFSEEKPKEKEKIAVPSYAPKHFCKGKGCEGHDNPEGYTSRVKKKCNNCDQVAPGNAGKCAWCGEDDFSELDEDDLEKLRIPKGEHDHNEHE